MPPELKALALSRLQAGRQRYEQTSYAPIIDRLISTVESVEFKPAALAKFIQHIQIEDTVSKKPLSQVVPEWAPWFD